MKTYNYIYLITNNLNGKIYVGKHSTDNLNDGYMGSGKLIKLAYNKYGIENFTKQILAFSDTEDELNNLEMFYIKDLDAKTKGYNLTDGGDGFGGCSHSEESKRKISEAFKGKKRGPRSEETKQKISKTKKGTHVWNKGKTGLQTAWNKGKHHSEETKQKIKDAWQRRKNKEQN